MYVPRFSIIVPCCDVEQYCADCIASVKSQTFADFECIVVIEESKDGTDASVEAAIAGDGRFRIFRQARSGSPATPRNTGLDAAQGEWIVFLDGDDELESDALEKLDEAARNCERPDILAAAVVRTDGWTIDNWGRRERPSMDGLDATLTLSKRTALPFAMAFLNVYRREFIERKRLRFIPGLKHEDEEFSPRALYLAEKVAITHIPYYKYRLRDDSITAGAKCSHARDVGRAVASLAKFYASRTEAPVDVQRAWARMTLSMFNHALFGKHARCLNEQEVFAALEEIQRKAGYEFAELVAYASPMKRLNGMLVKASWKMHSLWWLRLWFSVYYKVTDSRLWRGK